MRGGLRKSNAQRSSLKVSGEPEDNFEVNGSISKLASELALKGITTTNRARSLGY